MGNNTERTLVLSLCASIWLPTCTPELDVGEYTSPGSHIPGDDAHGDAHSDSELDSSWEQQTGGDGFAGEPAEGSADATETDPTCNPETEPTCECKTCQELGANCGTPSDRCSGWLRCGSCEEPEYCGGGGTPFVCACKPGTWWVDAEPSHTLGGESRAALALLGDKIHLIYRVGPTPGLYHAIRTAHGPWTQSPVDSTGKAIGDLALTVDDAGGLHAAYVISDGALMYAYKAADAGWSISSVDTVGIYDRVAVSLAVDPSGGVNVAYGVDMGADNTAIWYASRVAGQTTWDKTQLSTLGAFGKTAIAADSSGGVHVTFNGGDNHLGYAYRPAGLPWTTEPLDTDHRADDDMWHYGADSSVAVDLAGGVHVIYLFATDYYADNSGVYLRHGYKARGGSWDFSTVDGIGGGWVRIRTSMGLSGSGVPHIMVSHRENATVQHLWNNGASWVVEPIDSFGQPSCETAPMAFDATGGLHAVYSWNDGNYAFGLRYAFRCP